MWELRVSGLLFTVLELPVLWAALGVGDSLLSSLLAVSELPDPELTPLKYFHLIKNWRYYLYLVQFTSNSSRVSPFLTGFYGYLGPDNAGAVLEKFIIL